MEIQRIFLDANVIYSRTLRDWIFLLRIETQGRMFTVATSEDALVEAQHAYRKSNPGAQGSSVSGIREKVIEFCDEVVSDYPGLKTAPMSDKYDWHIHSAVLEMGSHILVTRDKGFLNLLEMEKEALPYEIHTPDELLVLIDDSAPQFVSRATKNQSEFWANHDSESNIIGLEIALVQSGCPVFAARIRKHLQDLAGMNLPAW
jgi:predicted nucleic acid-binding protein